MNDTILAVSVGAGEVLIVLLCLIGLALAAALAIGVVFLVVRSATHGRDAERRLTAVEGELRELKKRLKSEPSPSPEGAPKKSRRAGG
jgi:hypothetical protein